MSVMVVLPGFLNKRDSRRIRLYAKLFGPVSGQLIDTLLWAADNSQLPEAFKQVRQHYKTHLKYLPIDQRGLVLTSRPRWPDYRPMRNPTRVFLRRLRGELVQRHWARLANPAA